MIRCTYCDKEAVEGGYIQPPMCPKHHSVAILISMLKSRGQITSRENIKLMANYYPKAGVRPNEVEALLEPMRKEEVAHV
jgi:hypothetical protein